MHRFKILGLALMAVFAVAASTTAIASAEEALPEFLTKTGWTGTSGEGKLLSAGGEIKCTAGTNEGEMEASKKLGAFILFFTGCKSAKPIAGLKCNSEGDAAEVILTKGTWHLVLLTIPHVINFYLIWFLVTPFTVNCGGGLALFKITGNVLGEITPANTLTKKYHIIVNVVSGRQGATSFTNDNGERVGASLLSNNEPATFASAGNFITMEKDTLIIN
jgi:hypothetical protein